MTSLLLINPAAAHNRRTSVAVLCVLLMLLSVACAKRSRAPAPNTTPPDNYASASQSTQRINVNTAPVKELEALPGIGKGLAERIVAHREKYGPFRRAEHLMMVRGISETRFRALREMIEVK